MRLKYISSTENLLHLFYLLDIFPPASIYLLCIDSLNEENPSGIHDSGCGARTQLGTRKERTGKT